MTRSLDRTRRTLLIGAGGLVASGGCLAAPQAGAGGTSDVAADDHHGGDPHDDADGHHDEDDGHHGAVVDHHEPEVHHEEETPHQDEGHGGEGPADHVEVAMQSTSAGEHFHPHVAWVTVGGTVDFVNESGAHTATAYHPDNGKPLRMPAGAEPFDSGLLTGAGETYEHTFETEGVYDVYCAPHEGLGMIGSVVVGRPDPHDQPGMAEPQAGMAGTVSTKIAALNHQVDAMLGHEH